MDFNPDGTMYNPNEDMEKLSMSIKELIKEVAFHRDSLSEDVMTKVVKDDCGNLHRILKTDLHRFQEYAQQFPHAHYKEIAYFDQFSITFNDLR